MGAFLIAVAAGIIPMLVYPVALYFLDRYEKEPLPLLLAVFLWGFVPAAVLSLISQLIIGIPLLMLDETGLLADQVLAVAVAPVSEECFKAIAVLAVYLIWRREFDGVLDGVVYGGLVGFGFAAIENVLYFLEVDAAVIVMRTIVFGLNHAFYTSLTGIGFGIARHSRKGFVRFFAPVAGLIMAIAAHAVHNTTVTFAETAPALCCFGLLADYGGIAFVLGVVVLTARQERQWITEQLQGEIESGTLTQPQYDIVVSPARRFAIRMNTLFSGGVKSWWGLGQYFQVLTKLAYKKYARQRRGDKGAAQAEIDDLRAKSAALSESFPDLA
ncbi:MAG: PrsW family intramembrane metalloprotease [Anaerolineae bacterium]|nr:PrsW family intramembrane metalloprotease [Anaerolineae bacterium]